jgi:hypothetical protein
VPLRPLRGRKYKLGLGPKRACLAGASALAPQAHVELAAEQPAIGEHQRVRPLRAGGGAALDRAHVHQLLPGSRSAPSSRTPSDNSTPPSSVVDGDALGWRGVASSCQDCREAICNGATGIGLRSMVEPPLRAPPPLPPPPALRPEEEDVLVALTVENEPYGRLSWARRRCRRRWVS